MKNMLSNRVEERTNFHEKLETKKTEFKKWNGSVQESRHEKQDTPFTLKLAKIKNGLEKQ